mgnify:CR=1 FL=1
MSRMSIKEKRRLIALAAEKVTRRIKGHASRGGPYAGALSAEGYNGGYRDALYDVQILMNGVRPNRENFYDEEATP